jgi:hypothetical protein
MNVSDLVGWWMLNAVKSLFFEMPLEKIVFECSEDVYGQFKRSIDNCEIITRLTNDAIIKYSHLGRVAADNGSILFVNIDDSNRYRCLYDEFRNVDAGDILYLSMNSGFNANECSWEDTDVPIPLDDLINFVISKKIRKIVSINHYFLDKYIIKTGVYLLPLFRYLGVEYVIIDQDPWDTKPLGYLIKLFYNCNSFDRFSSAPFLNRHWDNKYELENVRYIAVPQDYGEEGAIQDIQDDYAILVLSNSRLANVKALIGYIIYSLDHMSEDSVFTEVQCWYMALRFMILEIMKLDDFEKLYCNSVLHRLFYAIMQFLKYEIIEDLETLRDIEIYGDVGWQTIFPGYYKTRLNHQQMDELFMERNHLYLLLNHVLSYLEASGPVFDAIKRKVPFINMQSLVKTRSFEGFRHIEYGNKNELNYLTDNIRTVVGNNELKDSIRIFRNILISNESEIVEKVVSGRSVATDKGIFDRECREHQLLLDRMIEEYIDRNEAFLRESFDVLVLGRSIQYDHSKSRYFNRTYVQRILQS